jgi:hypothetical protein
MTAFVIAEPVQRANSTTFAKALMKIMLSHGISHTIVLDKDSKFYGSFRETCDLLQLNVHTLSGENHKAMLVERVLRFFNRSLTVMSNERDSVRISDEGIQLSAYAWNSAPIAGTDLSRSKVAMGREFHFPIDFSVSKHLELISTPNSVQSFAKNQAKLMEASLEIAKTLLQEHRAWHRELVNASRPDPRIWQVGDIVFARRATRSHKGRGIVGKLQYAHTGPWRVTKKLEGSSYELAHCLKDGLTLKKHASHLSPFPLPLVPFEPVDGPDNRYGQIHRPIGKTPYSQAGIDGFEPLQPFQLPPASHYTAAQPARSFHWPSLSELNDEMCPFPWTSGEMEQVSHDDHDDIVASSVMYTGPPPTMPKIQPPNVPSAGVLASQIVKSSDRLFFISHEIPNSSRREWRLVRVHLEDSMMLRPTCLSDGRFLVEFFIAHSADVRYNAANQRFWLEYHKRGDLINPSLDIDTHLIRPSDTSEQLAARHQLVPFRQWVNLTHECIYIHGPFEFATINGRKTRDRVASDDWNVLIEHKDLYSNNPPSMELPTYSVHIDRGVHISFVDKTISKTMLLVAEEHSKHGERVL